MPQGRDVAKMTEDAYIDSLARAAQSHGLDGRDMGRLRDFIWWQCLNSDAVDDGIIEQVGRRLISWQSRAQAA